jgi:hypothetical protein
MADIHSFNVSVAVKYGVNPAILLRYFSFWIEKNEAEGRHFHDGNCWTYCSISGLQQLFPYMGDKAIRNAIEKLVDSGLIVKGNYNAASYDRTTWYALTTDGKAALQAIRQKGQMDLPLGANGIAQKGEPIPFSNTVNKERNIKERKSAYGVLGNVFLTDEELAKLKSAFKSDWQRRIDTLSEYIASKGDKYKSHYATILNWYRRENGGKSVAEREYF